MGYETTISLLYILRLRTRCTGLHDKPGRYLQKLQKGIYSGRKSNPTNAKQLDGPDIARCRNNLSSGNFSVCIMGTTTVVDHMLYYTNNARHLGEFFYFRIIYPKPPSSPLSRGNNPRYCPVFLYVDSASAFNGRHQALFA